MEKRKMEQKQLTLSEIKEAFPEGKFIIARLLRNKRAVLDALAWRIKDITTNPELTENDKMFLCQYLEVFEIAPILKDYNRLLRYKFIYSNKENQVNLEAARAVPIESLFDCKIKNLSRDKAVMCCPIHTEKTASFHIYRKTNSFYCFGCNVGGDVIHLVKLIYGLDFQGAIKFLSNYKE